MEHGNTANYRTVHPTMSDIQIALKSFRNMQRKTLETQSILIEEVSKFALIYFEWRKSHSVPQYICSGGHIVVCPNIFGLEEVT